MKKLEFRKKNCATVVMQYVVLCFFMFASLYGFSQKAPTVKSTADTTLIKIGEQIRFEIQVEVDSLDQVIFPEGQTFAPLEMVEAYKIDTVKKKDRILLQRIYALTQFDSGVYNLPRQKVIINSKDFFTDSLHINVATVAVDTIAQKMYDIKPMIAVEKSSSGWWKIILGIVLGLAVIGGLLYWFVFREKPLTEDEKVALLPPFDRAILELKKLENSKYIIQDEYKQYYSELTNIVRSYIEEDVHVTALESTTDQLIEKLELLKDAGELELDTETINQFKKVLQTADLVKFAKSRPADSVAEQDRKSVEQIVIKTKEAIPEPTAEELLENEEYLEELAKKQQKKKWFIAAAAVAGVFFISVAATIGYYGFGSVKDTVLRHPTKQLLDGEWISSSYGYPPISIETPKVMLRQEVPLPPEAKATVKELSMFIYRNAESLFTVATTATMFVQQEEPDFEKTINNLLKNFEDKGAKNITTKQEDFVTLTGVKGIKTYGSGQFSVPESKELIQGKYVILSFGGKGFLQQVLITWQKDDTYAEEMVTRILNSVEVKSEA
ncbi:MAG: hypothetical protein V3U92_07375 [Cellulophaga sp.]